MSHKQLYQRIKIETSNKALDEITHFASLFQEKMKKRKPHGKAGREARKFSLDAFALINRIAKEARRY